nr:NAD-dependent epimerase/dehydratase family protein [Candidatus Micropelagos thuwalensis]
MVLRLLKAGHKVTCFDLNPPQYEHPNLTIVQGDIRDRISIIKALENVEVIHHNVAQVPIAKDRKLFWSVNYEGMKILLDEVLKKR